MIKIVILLHKKLGLQSESWSTLYRYENAAWVDIVEMKVIGYGKSECTVI